LKPEIREVIVDDRLMRQKLGDVEFLVVEVNDKVVGFCLLKWYGKETHLEYPDIEDLYINENQRRRGYGSILIQECEFRARQKGYAKIGMTVNPKENPIALNLYKNLGYKPTGEDAYIDGVYNGVEDWCIDLVKNLDNRATFNI
jgi:ribosomal protein S18 acetylase RimI-like enzyme